jgi:hypothetical protein
MSNIYEMARAQGFEFTGEYRRIKDGEWFWGCNGQVVQIAYPEESLAKYLVLRKIKRTFEFDGQKFECPEGYIFERVGIPCAGDVWKYIWGDITDKSGFGNPHHLTPDTVGMFKGTTYFIFRKESK